MFIEKLEDRRLLSVSAPAVAMEPLPPHPAGATTISTNKADNPLVQQIDNALQGKPFAQTVFRILTSGSQRIPEDGQLQFQRLNTVIWKEGGKTVTAAISYSVTIEPGTSNGPDVPFDPSTSFSPFLLTYNFTLNNKNPSNLFNITRSQNGAKFQFTGKISKGLSQVSGILKLTAPGRHQNIIYTGTLSQTGQ